MTDLCAIKQKTKIKNIFANASISFKKCFKQVPVPFKIYADFECLLKGVKSSDKNNGSYTKKLFVLIINLVGELFFTEEKMLLTDLLKQFLKSKIIVKK